MHNFEHFSMIKKWHTQTHSNTYRDRHKFSVNKVSGISAAMETESQIQFRYNTLIVYSFLKNGKKTCIFKVKDTITIYSMVYKIQNFSIFHALYLKSNFVRSSWYLLIFSISSQSSAIYQSSTDCTLRLRTFSSCSNALKESFTSYIVFCQNHLT